MPQRENQGNSNSQNVKSAASNTTAAKASAKKSDGQQLLGMTLEQDPNESLQDIKKEEAQLEKDIDLDKKNVATLKERLENQQKLLSQHE